MGRFKYFLEEEVVGLKDDLVFRLDRARDLFGAAIIITSGYRDPEHNDNIGGVKDSAHSSGLAVDIRCPDKEMQTKLAWALGAAGFRRIGVYNRHIHCDVDSSKPIPAYWTGVSH